MKRWMVVLLAGVLVSGFSTAMAVDQSAVSKTIRIFKESPEVRKFFNSAYGFAVFPTVGKGGIVVGGAYGEGKVFAGENATGTAKLMQASVGFQLGGQAFREIIFFENKTAYDAFTSGSFEFGGNASAVVITAGAQGSAGTTGISAGASAGPATGVQSEALYVNGMAVFIHTIGGLMYELSLAGQKFTFEPM